MTMNGSCSGVTAKATLSRKGNLYAISPWFPGLAPLLTYIRRENVQPPRYPEPDPVLGYIDPKVFTEYQAELKASKRPKLIEEKLYTVSGNGVEGLFAAGLLHRVIQQLKLWNVEFQIVDTRDLAKLYPVPRLDRIEPLREGQLDILKAVALHDGGHIVAATGAGKSFIIKQICLMYPDTRIVITSPRVQVVKQIAEDIAAVLGNNQVGCIRQGKQITNRRVTVTTTASMHHADLDHCDLFLFDEVHGIGYNATSEMVSRVVGPRMFGFTATPVGRSDNAELVIEALFGPKLIDMSYQDSVDRKLVTPLEVWWLDCPIGPAIDENFTSVKKRRMAYWRNDWRNNMVRKLVDKMPAEEQILIMTETLEHAVALHKLLPEFKVAHYGKLREGSWQAERFDDYKMSSHELDNIRHDFAEGKLKRVISTMVFKEGVNFPELAMLIRVDGQRSPLNAGQIPGRLSRLSAGKQKGILVDFCDSFSEWAKDRSKARLTVYKNNKWEIKRLTL